MLFGVLVGQNKKFPAKRGSDGRKRDLAREAGEPERSLIEYADFTDYTPIMVRKDNWESIFQPIFKRQNIVQESFQRLYLIRVCTMHARIITQDDEFYLHVETKRIFKPLALKTDSRLVINIWKVENVFL